MGPHGVIFSRRSKAGLGSETTGDYAKFKFQPLRDTNGCSIQTLTLTPTDAAIDLAA